jgi:PAS domain S-box-containing protein
MLVLILDPAMTLAYASGDAVLPFAPALDAIGKPVTDCAAVMQRDPGLPAACRSALAGHPVAPYSLRPASGDLILRRIGVRRDADQRPVEVVVTYEIDPDLHDVVIGAEVGTWSYDVVRDTVRINDRFAQILGHARADLSPFGVGRWQEMIHAHDKTGFAAALTAMLQGRLSHFDAVVRLRNQDGGWTWCAIHGGVAERGGDGMPLRISGVMLDHTPQHMLEAELRRRDAAITATGDGLCITDETGVIVDANPVLARMLGHLAQGAVTGAPWTRLFAPASVARLRETGLDSLHRVGVWHGPALMRRQDGSDLEVDLSLTEMQDRAIIWICRDVTARNRNARQLLAMRDNIQRLQRQEIVNLIAAGLTHDLTNLVALIAHLSDPDARKHFAQTGDVLDEIQSAARQMVGLLGPIKQLGRRQSQPAVIDLAALLTEAAGLIRMAAPQDLRIVTEIADAALHVTGDRMQLMQVLLNLGLNARQAVAEGAQTITLSLSRATALPKGAKLETGVIPIAPFALFAVSDTGPGIDAATRAKIWEPYFTTKTLTGSGLGLFVVADIVRTAGGGIGLVTAPGKGTTFYIAWPLDQGA